eukprot:TRINITY_DN4779_c0_g1_i1.p1 TRINITY_DN4779_c0_g1~~TRINITY_DN4779_c0_g1_i1.p1  ORF type:complete len:310 (+),score=58.38 TRINITY_DN4779_c0_g1_i1:31-930(+)
MAVIELKQNTNDLNEENKTNEKVHKEEIETKEYSQKYITFASSLPVFAGLIAGIGLTMTCFLAVINNQVNYPFTISEAGCLPPAIQVFATCLIISGILLACFSYVIFRKTDIVSQNNKYLCFWCCFFAGIFQIGIGIVTTPVSQFGHIFFAMLSWLFTSIFFIVIDIEQQKIQAKRVKFRRGMIWTFFVGMFFFYVLSIPEFVLGQDQYQSRIVYWTLFISDIGEYSQFAAQLLFISSLSIDVRLYFNQYNNENKRGKDIQVDLPKVLKRTNTSPVEINVQCDESTTVSKTPTNESELQ